MENNFWWHHKWISHNQSPMVFSLIRIINLIFICTPKFKYYFVWAQIPISMLRWKICFSITDTKYLCTQCSCFSSKRLTILGNVSYPVLILWLPGSCPMGFFGYLCQYACHCQYGAACHSVTGECFEDCEFGWSGKPTCQISRSSL